MNTIHDEVVVNTLPLAAHQPKPNAISAVDNGNCHIMLSRFLQPALESRDASFAHSHDALTSTRSTPCASACYRVVPRM